MHLRCCPRTIKGQAQESTSEADEASQCTFGGALCQNCSRTSSFPWAVLRVRVLLNVKTRAWYRIVVGPNFSTTGYQQTAFCLCLLLVSGQAFRSRAIDESWTRRTYATS